LPVFLGRRPAEPVHPDLAAFYDVLAGESYDRSTDEMRDSGLYVDLESWKYHLFQMRAL
jgi:hypothetical protein